MKKLNILIIVIVLLVLANMTVMVFLSGGSKMAENNGAAVLTKHRDFTKTVTIQLMIKGGLFAENKENNGIGSLFSRVWVKSNKVLETVEFYGGSVSAKVSPFALEVRLSVPSDKIDKVYNDFAAFLQLLRLVGCRLYTLISIHKQRRFLFPASVLFLGFPDPALTMSYIPASISCFSLLPLKQLPAF